MTNFLDLYHRTSSKTRVLLFTKNNTLTKLLKNILIFNDKDFDLFSNDEINENIENDFSIFQTTTIAEASKFQPNIALISNDTLEQDISEILNKIIPGGVLIYPEHLSETVKNTEVFFRKIPYTKALFQQNKNTFTIETQQGQIPVAISDEETIAHLNGIKLLCQQFGIMEDEFYEGILNCE